jgi:hypothetical protein
MQMAEQEKPKDLRSLQMELKRQKREAKMRKKQLKRERKMNKREIKQQRKEAQLRMKLAKSGIKLPPKEETKPKEGVAKKKQAVTAEGSEIPEAEIISEADKWTPKSAKKLDEIQKMIDRMDHSSVRSLRDRYKERYGEDLEVPDVYEAKASLEVETATEEGELEPAYITHTGEKEETKVISAEKKGRGFSFARPAKKKEKKEKVERPLRFLDYRTPWYLRDKFAADGGKVKRGILLIIDLILNILLGIILIKIIFTIIYIIKDRRLQKQLRALEQESAQPQPTS